MPSSHPLMNLGLHFTNELLPMPEKPDHVLTCWTADRSYTLEVDTWIKLPLHWRATLYTYGSPRRSMILQTDFMNSQQAMVDDLKKLMAEKNIGGNK